MLLTNSQGSNFSIALKLYKQILQAFATNDIYISVPRITNRSVIEKATLQIISNVIYRWLLLCKINMVFNAIRRYSVCTYMY